MRITKGQIVCITTGSYSDYGIRGHMRAIADFDAKEEAKRFRETGDFKVIQDWDMPDGEVSEYGADDRFQAWLIREGIMEPVDGDHVVELHLGDYGRLEI